MNPEDIEFPVNLTLRIIAKDDPTVTAAIQAAARDRNLISPLTQGNQSASGTYVTHHIDATFTDLQQMRATFAAIGAVEGVRMVL